MRIDIVVPNFDSSSEDVTLSSWYKKEGDKICKNEVIADAETSTVACGITSSYDCLLVKILAKEGQVIAQGSKIAIIETDLSAAEKIAEAAKVLNEAKEVSASIDKEIQDDVAAAKEDNLIRKEFHPKKEDEIEEETEEEFENAEEDDDGKGYTWSVATNPSEEILKESEKILEESEKIEEKVADVFSHQAQENFKEILKDAESNAKKEAQRIRENIIAEAQKDALIQADKLKNQILKEYESKAIKDANEMHQKIIQGSISEAEATKAQLISEAQSKAQEDAEKIRESILKNAELAAQLKANDIINDAVTKAKSKAEFDADEASKEILEQAIQESKSEAKEIKKDILHTARRHVAKESENIVRQARKKALAEANYHAEELIISTIQKAKEEAENVRGAMLLHVQNELRNATTSIVESIKNEFRNIAQEDLRHINHELHKNIKNAEDLVLSVVHTAEQESEHIKNEVLSAAKEKIRNISLFIVNQAKEDLLRYTEGDLKNMTGTLNQIKNEVMSQAQREVRNSVVAMIDFMREGVENAVQKDLELIREEIHKSTHHNIGRINHELKQRTKEAEEFISSSIEATKQETAKILATEIIEKKVLDKEYSAVKKNFENELKRELKKELRREEALKEEIMTREICEAQEEICREIQNKMNRDEQTFGAGGQFSTGEAILDKCECENLAEEQHRIVERLLHAEENRGGAGMNAEGWNKPHFIPSPDEHAEDIDILRKRIAEKMKAAYDSSVISTVSNEVDMSAILTLEKTFGKKFTEKHNTRLGFTPFFVIAAIAALKEYKIFNAYIIDGKIIYKENFDISIVTCGNDGIAAPVIRHCDTLSIAEIEKAMISLTRRAVEGTLSIEEVSGGTFTIINAGVYGSLIGTDLLTPPQVATLSVHKMHNRPIATDNGVEVRPMLYVSLSYDHRISDTKQAAEFLSKIKNFVENPGWNVLEL